MDVRVQLVLALLQQETKGELEWAKLSDLVGLSESRLRHLFTSETGISPREYFVKLRLARAEKLLSDERLSISQIGFRLGWQERSHFERRFKNHYGITPAKYRNMVRKRMLTEKLFELSHSGHNIASSDQN